ncbi:unnamed protein product [Agarophyton chilense]
MATLRHGPPVFRSGWLKKEGTDGKHWDRFMRLSGTALSNSHSDVEQPSWSISLLENPVTIGPRPLEIQIQLRRRTLSYFVSDEQDYRAWQHALTRAMEMRIDNFYKFGHVLGEGSFATVRLARDIVTDQQFAVKIVHKDMYKPEELLWVMREVKIMMNVQHANIVDTYDIFDSRDHLHLVIEYGTFESTIDSTLSRCKFVGNFEQLETPTPQHHERSNMWSSMKFRHSYLTLSQCRWEMCQTVSFSFPMLAVKKL